MNYTEMTKPALVDLAVEREVAKNKTAARKTDKAELIRLLDVDDIKRRGAAHAAAKAEAVPDATHGVHGLVPSAHAIQHGQPSTIPAPPEPGEDIADSVAKVLAADKLVAEHDVENDGRHIADIPAVPGAMAYGDTPEAAERSARAIAAEAMSPPKKRAVLTSEQRQNKLRRNRRKHRARLAGRSARRGSGQPRRQANQAA
jgi:hypothetical protein